jgi:hypothetical protein
MTDQAGPGRTRLDADVWVEVELEILPVGTRAPQIPADTAGQPYVALLAGRLVEPAVTGEYTTVETFAGRRVSGVLRGATPVPPVSFGPPDPSVLEAAGKVVASLRDRRAGE